MRQFTLFVVISDNHEGVRAESEKYPTSRVSVCAVPEWKHGRSDSEHFAYMADKVDRNNEHETIHPSW